MKKVALILTLLLSLSLFGSILTAQPPPQPGRPGRGEPPPMSAEDREKFRVKLGITTQQQEKLDALFAETHKQRMELGKRLGELFQARQKVCDVYELDRSRENAIRNEIKKVYAQLLDIHITTEEKLRRILSKEQFDRLRELREEGMKKMRRGGFGWKGNKGGSPPSS